MPTEPAIPAFPRRESLAAFFRTPPDALVPLSDAAALLGTSVPLLRAILDAEGVQPARDAIPWGETAAYLFDAWPRARIFNALGAEAANVIPAEFLLTRVNWTLPIFVVRAIKQQAAAAVWRDDPRLRRRAVNDYVADLLYNDISPATVAAFRNDSSFLRAFHYPILD